MPLASVLTRSRSTRNIGELTYEEPSLLQVVTEGSHMLALVGEVARRTWPWAITFLLGWVVGRIW